MNLHQRIIRASNLTQSATLGSRRNRFLFIPWRYATHIGFNPNLKEVGSLIRRMVELAVHHARTSTHALHIARRNSFHITDIVLVR